MKLSSLQPHLREFPFSQISVRGYMQLMGWYCGCCFGLVGADDLVSPLDVAKPNPTPESYVLMTFAALCILLT